MNVFVFDIETVPDVATGRKLLALETSSDTQVANAMQSLTQEATGQTFIKHHCQKIVAISVVFRNASTLKIWSLGDILATEPEIIGRFFAGIDKYLPTLVSWNGSGFDLPVLHYRALFHGVAAKSYWECGENNSSFKYNNYLNRYHMRHLDLMDMLAGFQQKAFVKLDEIAVMLGLPGKMGMNGGEVWDNYQQGKIEDIRHYCEIDVLNTYLIFLRTQMIRGVLSLIEYEEEVHLTKTVLQQSDQQHLQEFLEAWESR